MKAPKPNASNQDGTRAMLGVIAKVGAVIVATFVFAAFGHTATPTAGISVQQDSNPR